MYVVYNVETKEETQVVPNFLIQDLLTNTKNKVETLKDWTVIKSKKLHLMVKPYDCKKISLD
jgi:hypothetical protein